jgi:hypothetical protein
MMNSKQAFTYAGVFSLAVALFQAVITFSPSWSRYFGAPEELVANTIVLIVAGLAAAVIFALFGLYALAGAGHIRPLPLLRLGVIVIGSLYTARGLMVIPQLLAMIGILRSSETIPPQAVISSLVSLFIGLLYFIGIISRDKRVKAPRRAINALK